MGIEKLLLCSIFFEDPSNLPMFGDGELVKRAELNRKANDVGTSGYQTFLTDPQPSPAFKIETPDWSGMISYAKPIIHEDSITYINQNHESLGGIIGLNPEEIRALFDKHFSESD